MATGEDVTIQMHVYGKRWFDFLLWLTAKTLCSPLPRRWRVVLINALMRLAVVVLYFDGAGIRGWKLARLHVEVRFGDPKETV